MTELSAAAGTMPADAPVVSVNGLKKSFGNVEVIKDVSFDVSQGQVLSILGPSGSGKTTMLRCINALERPDSGVISVGGVSLDYGKGKPRFRDVLAQRRHTAMVFQHYNLFKNKTVLRNVTEGLTVVQRKNGKEAEEIARNALEAVGMAGFEDRYPNNLSGGQQQRVSIARALALNPSVILFDEPTSALDPERVNEVLKTMKDIAARGVTMIVVTHEIRFARAVSDSVIFMDGGKIVEQGAPQQVIGHPQTERLQEFLNSLAPHEFE